MPLGPDPARAQEARAALAALVDTAAGGEDDVLAALVVLGEPGAQRVLDDWLDQVADTLRALAESAGETALGLAGAGAPARQPQPPGPLSPLRAAPAEGER